MKRTLSLGTQMDRFSKRALRSSLSGAALAIALGLGTTGHVLAQGAPQPGAGQQPTPEQLEAARLQQEQQIAQARATAQILRPAVAPIIKGISVAGNQRIEPETVSSYLTLQPGMAAEEELLDLQVKTLFQTGLFTDVSAEMQPNGTLLVTVKENPIVNRILFEGNKRLKDDKFTEEIQLTARSIYTRAKVQADQQRMIEIYRATGRFATNITPKVVPLAQNRVDVIFEIDEGPKTGIAKVNFVGNDVFTSAELRKVILTSESRWWNFFGGSTSNYDPDRLEFERELLRQHYAKNGYADFKVTSLVAELTPDRKEFFVTFTIEEGPQYVVGEVKVRSALDKLDEDAVERFVPVRTGQTFNGERVEKAVESLTFLTGASGYAFVDVNPRFSRYPESKKIDITFDINEGPKVYVERVNIKGNITTLDKVIRRELRIAEGDPFNKVQVDRSESVIRSLGFFSDVTIEEKPGSAPDRTELDVTVSEQATGSFSIGVGVSSTDNFIADVSIEQRNFLGRGEAVRFRVQASQRTRQVDLRYTKPRFLGRNLTAGASLFYSRVDNSLDTINGERGIGGFIQEQFGFGLNTGFQISEYGQAGINYLFTRSDVDFGTQSFIPITFTQFLPVLDVDGAPTFTDDGIPQLTAIVANSTFENGQFFRDVPVLDGEGLPQLDGDGNLITESVAFTEDELLSLLPENIQLAETTNALFGVDLLGNPFDSIDEVSGLISNGGAALIGSTSPGLVFDDCSDSLVGQPFRCESEGRFTTSLLSATVAFSTINDPFNPRNGWRARGTASFAGLGGNVQYIRSEFDTAYYKPLPVIDDFVGVLKLRGGYIRGFAGDTVRIQDRFRQGAASFRGFEIAGVGPRLIVPLTPDALSDPNQFTPLRNISGGGGTQTGNGVSFVSQSIGANAYLIGTAEILLPLPLPESYGIRASIFTDFGAVGIVDDETQALNDVVDANGVPLFQVNSLGVDLDGDGLVDPTIVQGRISGQGEPNPNAGLDFNSGFVSPIQDDFSFRLTAGVTVSWNSPFGPIRFDIAEVFIREFFDETESFRFSAGTSF